MNPRTTTAASFQVLSCSVLGRSYPESFPLSKPHAQMAPKVSTLEADNTINFRCVFSVNEMASDMIEDALPVR